MRKEIDNLIAEAMKNRDTVRLNVLKLIKTEFVKAEHDGISIDDATEVKMLLKMKAQREDSIAQYEAANRKDLVNSEIEELDILKSFIPAQPTDEDIKLFAETVINELFPNGLAMKDMKTVMTEVKKKYPSANGKLISDIVKNKIGSF